MEWTDGIIESMKDSRRAEPSAAIKRNISKALFPEQASVIHLKRSWMMAASFFFLLINMYVVVSSNSYGASDYAVNDHQGGNYHIELVSNYSIYDK